MVTALTIGKACHLSGRSVYSANAVFFFLHFYGEIKEEKKNVFNAIYSNR